MKMGFILANQAYLSLYKLEDYTIYEFFLHYDFACNYNDAYLLSCVCVSVAIMHKPNHDFMSNAGNIELISVLSDLKYHGADPEMNHVANVLLHCLMVLQQPPVIKKCITCFVELSQHCGSLEMC